MAKKLTDKQKVERIKPLLIKALYKAEHGYKDRNIVNVITRDICEAFAISDADIDDGFLIENVTVQMWLKVNGVKQLEFPNEEKQGGKNNVAL